MPCYLVRWEIDIDADTPEQAAAEARAIQMDRNNAATFYEVQPSASQAADDWQLVNLDTEVGGDE